MPQVASMGAAVAVADFDRDGWPDFYVTNSAEGSRTGCIATRATARSRTSRRAMGVADVNRAGTGVSMGAVWGDYDNDGYEDLFLYKSAGRSCSTTSTATLHAGGEKAGLPRWVNANSAIWLDYDRDGRLDLSSPATGPTTSTCGISRPHASCPRASSSPRTAAEVPVPQPWRRHVRGRRRQARDHVARWTLAAAAADLPAPAIPICSSPTTTASRSSISTRAEKGSWRSAAKPASAARQERNERRVRRHLQRRPPVDLCDQHLRARRAGPGQQPLGPRSAGARSSTKTSLELGVDLGGWSWGAQFGDLNNDGTLDLVSDQRLRVGRRAHAATGTTSPDRRRAQRDHRRRDELAGRCGAAACPAISASGSGSTTAAAGSPTSPRRSG